MRLLIGTDTYSPDVNGASRFTQALAAGMARRGVDVHVLCPSNDRSPHTSCGPDDVTVHRVASVGTPFHPTFRVSAGRAGPRTAQRLVHELGPDVVHCQGHFFLGRALLTAARGAGVPSVATNHFMPENLLGYAPWLPRAAQTGLARWAWADFARVFNRAHLVTSPTATACELINGLGLTPPVRPVSCGVDLQRFTPPATPHSRRSWPGLRPDRLTVLFVGRLDEEKHIEDLIDALALVRQHVDAQLLVVGTGGRREQLVRRAAEHGLGDAVVFAGYVSDQALPGAYAAADVFAIAGTAELQSLATMEAMSTGLPVVAADAMALPHLVVHGRNGLRFRPGDVPEAAAHLLRLLRSRDLRARMGAASLDLIQAHSVEGALDSYLALYDEVLRRPASPASAALDAAA